ncbi:MAG TPA: ROK family protein [Actinocrinis sp.]
MSHRDAGSPASQPAQPAGLPASQPAPGGGADFVVGVDFGGTKIAVATAALGGELLASARIDTDAPRGARQAVDRALLLAKQLIGAAEAATGGRCLAAAAVSPGVVREDGIAFAPNVPGWQSLALPGLLREGLGLDRVAYANDVKAAGVAEARRGALRDADPALFLSLGTGIGAAVFAGGRLVRGAHGAAGEIGYVLRGVQDVGGAASGRAPLEELAGGAGLAAGGARLLGRRVTAAQLFASADPRVAAFVDGALDELAVHVANLAVALDPQRVAVGGGFLGSAERILPALRRRLAEAVPFPPQLVRAHFEQDSALRGAVLLASDEAELARSG